MKKQKAVVPFLIVLALLAGLAGGYWYASSDKQQPAAPVEKTESTEGEPEVLFYRNPMNPAITSPGPAKDEMGMDYIPVYADDDRSAGEPAGTVTIDPVVEQNIGVRTAVAQKQVLNREIRSVGRVAYDEELLYRVHPKVEGWIEELYVKKTGQRVKEDEILLSIYSPQLVAGQQEYLIAVNNYEALKNSPIEDISKGAEELVESSRKRLEYLDVPPHQLKELIEEHVVKKSLHIHSPYAGIVLAVNIREGDKVAPRTQMYTLADLSRVWAYVDVYEFELPWIEENDPAEMTLAGVPGRIFTGKLDYIYPYMDKETRTVKVRLEFDNREGLLKPDMFGDVIIKAGRDVEAVVIPAEAVVRSGEREIVFISRGKGKFEPREVEIGVTASGLTQILAGVEEGERVVTSSQFLIDSESKLREATAKMMAQQSGPSAPEEEPAGADDMDMSGMSLENMEEELDMSDMTLENLE
ncbi:MAG: efflux RND transporter periplasmic adaptor subunit [Desulfobulbaceae bacterium]|nr:efflux RND transporter periplasmic adaptor subunit [Desulfobulbaceae bacterium]